MKLEAFKFRIEAGVAHITLNQPERGNPMDETFTREFSQLATECSVNKEVRAVLIDAAGRYFSVGGDIKAMTKDRGDFPRFAVGSTADLHMAVTRFARMNAPIVLAVHALAAGGGVSLTALADFVLAAPGATFYAAFLGIGISPDTGATYFLPRRIGSRRATEFLMRNQTLSAEAALGAGLITRIVDADALAAEAKSLALELAQGPTLAYGELRNLMLSSTLNPLEAQWRRSRERWRAWCAPMIAGPPSTPC